MKRTLCLKHSASRCVTQNRTGRCHIVLRVFTVEPYKLTNTLCLRKVVLFYIVFKLRCVLAVIGPLPRGHKNHKKSLT
jgi:hypothetical protein